MRIRRRPSFDCYLCHGWGEFDCMCDQPQPHVHACGNCAEGERLHAVYERLKTEKATNGPTTNTTD
jgi:hypothetical protein